jgi:hypothetical protein
LLQSVQLHRWDIVADAASRSSRTQRPVHTISTLPTVTPDVSSRHVSDISLTFAELQLSRIQTSSAQTYKGWANHFKTFLVSKAALQC